MAQRSVDEREEGGQGYRDEGGGKGGRKGAEEVCVRAAR
jgi:hypothetical protein